MGIIDTLKLGVITGGFIWNFYVILIIILFVVGLYSAYLSVRFQHIKYVLVSIISFIVVGVNFISLKTNMDGISLKSLTSSYEQGYISEENFKKFLPIVAENDLRKEKEKKKQEEENKIEKEVKEQKQKIKSEEAKKRKEKAKKFIEEYHRLKQD